MRNVSSPTMVLQGLLLIAALALLSVMSTWESVARAAVGEVITNYYTPCKQGAEGKVTTWHGKNRDGKPPYDPDRRTYDFRCPNEEIYSPAAGTVFGVTLRFGGVVLVQDDVNNACMVFLGMKTIAVESRQSIEIGTFIGTYRLFHFTAVDGHCANANWYDVAARERERPIQFIEFGEVIAPDIRRPEFYGFVSQNPAKGISPEAQTVKTSVPFDLRALAVDVSADDLAGIPPEAGAVDQDIMCGEVG